MLIELESETEKRVEEVVRSGRFGSPRELVEAAVQNLLDQFSTSERRFHALRRRIEESGIALLSDEELRREIQDRRGSRSALYCAKQAGRNCLRRSE